MVLGIPLPKYKLGKFPFFVTKLSCGRHDSTNFAEKVIDVNYFFPSTTIIFPGAPPDGIVWKFKPKAGG